MLHPGALSQKSFKKKIYLGLWKLLGLHKQLAVGSGQLAVGKGEGAIGNRQWAMGNEENAMGNRKRANEKWGNVFHATDEAEKKYIQQVFGPSSAAVFAEATAAKKATEGKSKVSIVVAANFPNVLEVQPVVAKEPGQLKLVSVALISAMKNVLLVLEALSSWQWAVGSGQLATGGSFNNEILPFAENDIDRFAQQKSVSSDQDDSLRGEGGGSEGHLFDNDEILPIAESDVDRFAQQTAVRSRQDDSLRGEGGGSREVSIEYNIYGPIKDKQYWEACEAQIKKLPPNIKVNYHGDIAPDKIEEALAANHVFILPSKSENFGHAIYEALSAGRPVITSNNTPWNKLEAAKAGINVSLNEPTELVHAIELFAAMKPEELEAWSNGARAYAESAVDVDAIRRQYEEMFG